MATTRPRALMEVAYEAAAQDYLRNLPPEHFMEATSQSRQREITLESLALVRARRLDFHVFNELLVQYERPGERKPGQVVPDNMVVLSDEPIRALSSYNVPLEPARPFWVLEYVSNSNKRKDYDENFDKYEKELKVPYYLIFYPDNQELSLYHLKGKRYDSVRPNASGRYAVREVEIEVALEGGWVRFWYRGYLLSLPAELQQALDAEKARADAEKRRADAEKRRADAEKRRADDLQHRLEQAQHQLEQLGGRASPARRGNGPRTEQ
jgi:Uma2 family endonuclease